MPILRSMAGVMGEEQVAVNVSRDLLDEIKILEFCVKNKSDGEIDIDVGLRATQLIDFLSFASDAEKEAPLTLEKVRNIMAASAFLDLDKPVDRLREALGHTSVSISRPAWCKEPGKQTSLIGLRSIRN